MSKAVLLSIKPLWCELIANGKKTVEVRKTRPKLETPFTVYIYCTKGSPYFNRHNGICYLEQRDILGGKGYGIYQRLNGKIIGEFTCDNIENFTTDYRMDKKQTDRISKKSCLSLGELANYEFNSHCLYAWHISDLKIYDKPKELSEFCIPCAEFEKDYPKCKSCDNYYYESNESVGFYDECMSEGVKPIKRPPQSWCYVEEVQE